MQYCWSIMLSSIIRVTTSVLISPLINGLHNKHRTGFNVSMRVNAALTVKNYIIKMTSTRYIYSKRSVANKL